MNDVPIEVEVAEVGDDERVLETGILTRIETIHSAESLAGRSSAEQLHLILGRKKLPGSVALLAVDGQSEDVVAVVGEDGSVRIVDAEGLRRRRFALDGPFGVGHAGLVQSFRQSSASGEDVQRLQRLHRRPARPLILLIFYQFFFMNENQIK